MINNMTMVYKPMYLFYCQDNFLYNSNPSISLQDFKHPLIFSQNVEESCTLQKIYGLRKVKLKIK